MNDRPSFRLFGFPVTVRPGFVILLALFAIIYSGQGAGELGFWLAGCIGAFTLMHELGHAFAARATGAEASISLDFLAGYASFEPTRPLKRWERAGISVAGPAVQIALGCGVLALMGSSPFHIDFSSAPQLAVWWAGPVIGIFNLFPVLPLDGGNIVMSGLDAIIPGRSRIVMVYASIVITVAAMVLVTTGHLTLGRLEIPPIFFVFPLIMQIQMLQHRHTQAALDQHGSWQRWAMNGEREAWTLGKPGSFPPGMTPSPWYGAALLGRAGNTEAARALLVSDFANAQKPNWMPPDGAAERELEALVNLLGDPLPTGNPYSEYVLASVLVRLGEFERAGQYAAASYGRSPGTMPAVVVAQSAAALNDDELAVRWLRAAYDIGTNLPGLAEAIDRRREFDRVRYRPDVVSLRHELASASAT